MYSLNPPTSSYSSPIISFGNKKSAEKTNEFDSDAIKEAKAQSLANEYFTSGFLESKAFFDNSPATVVDIFKTYSKQIIKQTKPSLISTVMHKLRKTSPALKETASISELNLVDPSAQNPRGNPISRMLLSLKTIEETDLYQEVKLTDKTILRFVNELKKELTASHMASENEHYRSQRLLSMPSYITALHENGKTVRQIMADVKSQIEQKQSLANILKSLNYIEMATDKEADSLLYQKNEAIGITRVGKIMAERLSSKNTK